VASYSQYREQKQQLANASKADPRSCPELLRMRDQAIANRNNMRSVSRQAGTSTSSLGGQAGSQQDAANAYTTIYNTYCR
jgi:hypothetical protein